MKVALKKKFLLPKEPDSRKGFNFGAHCAAVVWALAGNTVGKYLFQPEWATFMRSIFCVTAPTLEDSKKTWRLNSMTQDAGRHLEG